MGIFNIVKNDKKWFEESVIDTVSSMQNRAATLDIFDPKTTEALVLQRMKAKGIIRNDIIDVTPSHVIRLALENHRIDELLQKVNKF